MRDAQFDPDLSIAKLQALLNNYEMIWGTLQAVGTFGGQTIGSYDDPLPGTSKILLRPGPGAPNAGESVIDTNDVYILGQTQKITVYRAS